MQLLTACPEDSPGTSRAQLSPMAVGTAGSSWAPASTEEPTQGKQQVQLQEALCQPRLQDPGTEAPGHSLLKGHQVCMVLWPPLWPHTAASSLDAVALHTGLHEACGNACYRLIPLSANF